MLRFQAAEEGRAILDGELKKLSKLRLAAEHFFTDASDVRRLSLLPLSEASIEERTSTLKFARSPCTDPPGARSCFEGSVLGCINRATTCSKKGGHTYEHEKIYMEISDCEINASFRPNDYINQSAFGPFLKREENLGLRVQISAPDL